MREQVLIGDIAHNEIDGERVKLFACNLGDQWGIFTEHDEDTGHRFAGLQDAKDALPQIWGDVAWDLELYL